jgi:hypothetical protein
VSNETGDSKRQVKNETRNRKRETRRMILLVESERQRIKLVTQARDVLLVGQTAI